jgi:hypothetical protein
MAKVPDFIQLYTEVVTPCTESPIVYHDWAILTALGSLLSRNVWLEFGVENIYPNLYTILIGPAAGRKSSAINFARKTVELAGFKSFAKEKSSKEKFLADMEKGFGVKRSYEPLATDIEELMEVEFAEEAVLAGPASNVLITAGELLDFLGAGDLPFITLLTNLWDNLPKYEQPKLTGKDVLVVKPTVGMLGGATSTSFSSIFPPEIIGSGMLSRTLIVKADGRRQSLTLPPAPDSTLYGQLVDLIVEMRKLSGPISYTPEAYKLIDEIYKTEHPLMDTRFDTFVGRRHVQLHKLCLILTATALEDKIQPETVVYANTILHEVELNMQNALGDFGLSELNAKGNTIISMLNAKPCMAATLWKALAGDFKDKNEFTAVLHKLKSAGRINAAANNYLYVEPAKPSVNFPHYVPSLLNYRGVK